MMKKIKLGSSHHSVKALRVKRKSENMVERAKRKEKCTKDSDSTQSVVSRDVLEDAAFGVGEVATRKRSVGFNKSSQRAIPHKTRCKETFGDGRTQRRKGKVTASPKVKVKVEARAREDIQEKETTTRTRLDVRMKKLDSAGWRDLVQKVRVLNLLVMFKSTMMGLNCPERIEQLTCFAFKSARVS